MGLTSGQILPVSIPATQVDRANFYLCFQGVGSADNIVAHNIGLGSSYDYEDKNGGYVGYQAFAGYAQSDRFIHYLQPIWSGGKFSIQGKVGDGLAFLSIVDTSSAKGVKSTVIYGDYYQNLSDFSTYIQYIK